MHLSATGHFSGMYSGVRSGELCRLLMEVVMGKKVLAIVSSPRVNGNTDMMVDSFLKGARDAMHRTEKIYLRDFHIEFCRGCGVCSSTRHCVIKDDMERLIDKLVDADVIVFSTPVYFYSMCGQMKTFIDRLMPVYNELSGRDFYFIVAAADSDGSIESTMQALYGFTDCIENALVRGKLYGGGNWHKGDVIGKDVLKTAYVMGLNV